MLATLGIVILSSVITLIEFTYLFSKRNIKDRWIFFILLIFATGLGIAMTFQVNIPNPIDWVSFIYKPVSDFILRTFT